MSHLPLRARKLGLAGFAALAVFGATAAPSQAAQKVLTYQCATPLIGSTLVKVTVDVGLPTTIMAGKPAGGGYATVNVEGQSTAQALVFPEGSTLEGTVGAGVTVTPPGLPAVQVPISLPVPKQSSMAAGRLAFNAVGSVPPITFAQPGTAKVTVDSVTASLRLRDADGAVIAYPPSGAPDSDGDPTTFDVNCTLAPASQDTTLASITVTPAEVVQPSTPVASELTPTSAKICWKVPLFDVKLSYNVYLGSERIGSTMLTCYTVNGLRDDTTYTVKVEAIETSTSSVFPVGSVTFRTPAPTPPVDTIVDYDYSLAGSATLKTLVKGSIPLTGGIKAHLGISTGNFTGELSLNPATANLTALGFLPVVAKVAIVPTAPVTGSLVKGVLNANAKVRIKLTAVTLFGVPLGGGSSCQTKSPSSINLKSTEPFFYPTKGGPIAGTFAISDLTGCGALNGLLSPLTAGKGNAIVLNLAPLATPAAS